MVLVLFQNSSSRIVCVLKMEPSCWRSWAKFIGRVDIILLFLQLLRIVFILVDGILGVFDGSADYFARTVGTYYGIAKNSDYLQGLWVWSALMLAVVSLVVQLWATRQLIKSTQVEREPAEAWKLANTWTATSATLVIIYTLAVIVFSNSIISVLLMINIAWRLLCLAMVNKFVKELSMALPRNMPVCGVLPPGAGIYNPCVEPVPVLHI